MAVDTYAKLQSAISDTVDRDDLIVDVTTYSPGTIDGFVKRAIANSTAAIQRDLVSRGGNKNMETLTNALVTVSGTEYIDFPTDFAGARSFVITSDPLRVLEFVDPTTLFTQYPSSAVGKPEKYSIVGTNRAYLRPIPDSAYSTRLIYTQQLTAMSAASDSNWVLLYHPDIYVSRAMVEMCIYLEDDNRTQFWKGLYDQNINDLMGDDRNVRWAAVPTKPNLQIVIA